MYGNGGNGSIIGPGQSGQLSPGPSEPAFSSYNGSFSCPGPPASARGSLNISDPRYSAMYRNTLLRYSPTQESLPPPAPVYPGPAITSPYHTIRTQNQQYIQVGWNAIKTFTEVNQFMIFRLKTI